MATADSAVAGRGAKKRSHMVVLSALVVAALAALMMFVLASPRYISVPSGSMLPSIRVGDSVLVESLTYRLRGPQPGEIVARRSRRSGSGAGTSACPMWTSN